MSIHDYSNGAVTEFRNSMLNLESMVNDFTLTTEGMEFAWEDGIVEAFVGRMTVALINDIKKDLRNLFDSAGGTAIVTAGQMVQTDETAAGQFDEILRSMTLLENAVKGAAAVQNRCTGTKFTAEPVCADVEEIMTRNVVADHITEYVTKDEDGRYVYDYDNIHDLVMKGNSLRSVDYTILLTVMETTAEGEQLDTEAISSMFAFDREEAGTASRVLSILYTIMNGRTEVVMQENSQYLSMTTYEINQLSPEEQAKAQTLKNTIAATDVVEVLAVGYEENSQYNIQIHELEDRSRDLQDKTDAYRDLWTSKLIRRTGLDPMKMYQKTIKDYTDKQGDCSSTINGLEAISGPITVDPGAVVISFKTADDQDVTDEIRYYQIRTGDREYAVVTEHGLMNEQIYALREKLEEVGGENMTKKLNSLKMDTEETFEEYSAEQMTDDKKMKETIDGIKSIPFVGKVVGVGLDAAATVYYTSESLATGENNDNYIYDYGTGFLDDTISTVSLFSGADADGAAKLTEKAGEALIDTAKDMGDDYKENSELREEYQKEMRRRVEYNQKVDAAKDAYEAMAYAHQKLNQMGEEAASMWNVQHKNAFGSMTMYYDGYNITTNTCITD